MKASNSREKRTDLVSRKDISLFGVERPRSMADAVDHDHDHRPYSGWFIPRLNTAEPGGKKKKKREEKGKDWAQRVGKLCHFGPFFCYLVNVDGARSKAWQYATGIIYFSRHQSLLSRKRNSCLEGMFASQRGKLFAPNGEMEHWKFIVEQANECMKSLNRRSFLSYVNVDLILDVWRSNENASIK